MDSSGHAGAPGRGDYRQGWSLALQGWCRAEKQETCQGFESSIPGWTGPVLGRVLNEGGVAIPLCAAAPGGGGRAESVRASSSCHLLLSRNPRQVSDPRGQILPQVRRLGVCFPGFMYSLGPWYTYG